MTAPAKVLVVDDEPMVLSAIELFLGLETSYDVVSFTCPFAALSYLDEHEVDAVVCDLTMRRMTGEEFVSQVRRRNASLPCVFLTGIVDEARTSAGRACKGLFGFLRKPWCNDELRHVLERAVAKHRGTLQ